MAGKPKRRIDYAGWSVDIFSNDIKIDKLLDAQSWTGFGVYFYLCNMAFGSNGYYYEWCYDLCATTARKMGGGVGAGTVREAVDYCLQIGLFDKGLFDGWGVLTSRGIQKSYLIVLKSKNRKGTEIYKEYWLLDTSKKEDYQGVVFVSKNSHSLGENSHSLGENSHSLGENSHSLGENSHSLIQKESKVNKSKVNNNARAIERFEDFWSCYPLGKNKYLAEQAYIAVVSDGIYTEDDLVESAKNYAEYCKITGTDKIYHANNFLLKAHFEDYLPDRYKKPTRQKSKSNFNDFEQQNYDIDALEKAILSN